MSEEWYKKHRPTKLKHVVGNQETVASLMKMLKEGTLPHAILLTGPSGNGKTTLGRIIRMGLGCHDHAYHEVNSSNFRGIDTIRDIEKQCQLHPLAGPVEVWLLDEAHKLTNDAQNGILKIMEDTPPHVYFIVCTSEPQKLIKAIQTRCRSLPVKSLSDKELREVMTRVAEAEEYSPTQDVLDAIVDKCEGSARTALVMLEHASTLTEEQALESIQNHKNVENEAIDLCRAIMQKKGWKTVAGILENLKGEAESIRRNVLGYARTCLIKNGDWQAYNVICSFEKAFYDSGDAGLARASYEAVNAKE